VLRTHPPPDRKGPYQYNVGVKELLWRFLMATLKFFFRLVLFFCFCTRLFFFVAFSSLVASTPAKES
jgi:hypothetical protein